MNRELLSLQTEQEFGLDSLVKERNYSARQKEYLENLIGQILELKQGKSFAELEEYAETLKTLEQKKEFIERLRKLKSLLEVFEGILQKDNEPIIEVNEKYLEQVDFCLDKIVLTRAKVESQIKIAEIFAKAGQKELAEDYLEKAEALLETKLKEFVKDEFYISIGYVKVLLADSYDKQKELKEYSRKKNPSIDLIIWGEIGKNIFLLKLNILEEMFKNNDAGSEDYFLEMAESAKHEGLTLLLACASLLIKYGKNELFEYLDEDWKNDVVLSLNSDSNEKRKKANFEYAKLLIKQKKTKQAKEVKTEMRFDDSENFLLWLEEVKSFGKSLDISEVKQKISQVKNSEKLYDEMAAMANQAVLWVEVAKVAKGDFKDDLKKEIEDKFKEQIKKYRKKEDPTSVALIFYLFNLSLAEFYLNKEKSKSMFSDTMSAVNEFPTINHFLKIDLLIQLANILTSHGLLPDDLIKKITEILNSKEFSGKKQSEINSNLFKIASSLEDINNLGLLKVLFSRLEKQKENPEGIWGMCAQNFARNAVKQIF